MRACWLWRGGWGAKWGYLDKATCSRGGLPAAQPGTASSRIKKADHRISLFYGLVPEAGLEPARVLSPVDFESTASTNFATLVLNLRL